MNKYLLTLGLMLLTGNVLAGGWYRWVDSSGNVHYGDAPPAEAVDAEKQRVGNIPPGDNADLPYETRRAQQNFPVILYVVEKCGEGCQQARDLLSKRGIPFEEINLKTQEDFDEFKKMSGSDGVPSLVVGKVWLMGFQPGQWHSELDIAGYPKSAPYRPQVPVKAVKATEEIPNPAQNSEER